MAALAVLAVAAVACAILIGLKPFVSGARYDSAERYTAGGTTLDAPVRNLDIDWIDGSVTVSCGSQSAVSIAETAPKAISPDAALRWWLDGDTLRIRYAKSGFSPFRGSGKDLEVILPGDVSLKDVRVGIVSGTLAFDGTGAAAPDIGKMVLSGASGRIRASVGSVKEMEISTASGSISLNGNEVQKASVESASGAIDVALNAFGDLRIDAASGDVALALPSSPGYRAEIETDSGSFESSAALTRKGSAYFCGDGSGTLRVGAVSGDVRLEDARRARLD